MNMIRRFLLKLAIRDTERIVDGLTIAIRECMTRSQFGQLMNLRSEYRNKLADQRKRYTSLLPPGKVKTWTNA